ncbi:hypothetical protein V1511DRAFT_505034 [Dipodascopsis uninucleata]
MVIPRSLALETTRNAYVEDKILFGGSGLVKLGVSTGQDYFEAGKYCYLRTSLLNESKRTINKIKLKVVCSIKYLLGAESSKHDTSHTEEHVIAKSTFKASRDGWPQVMTGQEAAYTAAIQLPACAVTINCNAFKVSYFIDVFAGSYIGQYVRARFPILIFYKPQRLLISDTLSSTTGMLSSSVRLITPLLAPHLPLTPEALDTRENHGSPSYIIQNTKTTLDTYRQRHPRQKLRFQKKPENHTLNNGDGFRSMRTIRSYDEKTAANSRKLRKLLKNMLADYHPGYQRLPSCTTRATEDDIRLPDDRCFI